MPGKNGKRKCVKSQQNGNKSENKVTPDSKKTHTIKMDTSLTSTGKLVQESDKVLGATGLTNDHNHDVQSNEMCPNLSLCLSFFFK